VAVGTLATADAILKDVYRGPIIEQLNYKTYMLDKIERDSDSIEGNGRRWVTPVESSGNESPSSMSDGGTLVNPQVGLEQDAIGNAALPRRRRRAVRPAHPAGDRQRGRVRQQARPRDRQSRQGDAQEPQPAGVR
jgi:hypothetical protein